MKLLTRAEELVLIAIWRLQDNSSCVPIRTHLMDVTRQNWSLGSIYDALDRLEKKGYITSYLSEPLKTRGGRSRRIYKHSREGVKAILEMRAVQERVWQDLVIPVLGERS